MSAEAETSGAARNRAFGRFAAKFGGVILFLASTALAIGPDTWIEWLIVGITLISVPTARVMLIAVAALVLVALIWPLVTRRSS